MHQWLKTPHCQTQPSPSFSLFQPLCCFLNFGSVIAPIGSVKSSCAAASQSMPAHDPTPALRYRCEM